GAYLAESDDVTSPLDPAVRIAVTKAMADLPVDQRACVALCLASGFSHAEAAQALELPLGTVKSHVTRGREKLHAALGGSDESSGPNPLGLFRRPRAAGERLQVRIRCDAPARTALGLGALHAMVGRRCCRGCRAGAGGAGID